MPSADLYLRLSLDHDRATSIERQEADCRRWCAANDLSVRRVHVDRGVSAFNASVHRDGFEAALAEVITGAVSTLLVWKLDRLSRRGIGQVGQVLDRFETAGARLVCVQDGLDTAQPQARMIIALLSEFARAESETLGMRVKSAKDAQRAAGLWLGGQPPHGYAVAPDRRLMPVEPGASVMREVFERVIAGHSLVEICRRNNSLGIATPRTRNWHPSWVSLSLKSPIYAGLAQTRHITRSHRHCPIYPYLDETTGDQVSCLTPGAEPIVTRAQQLQALAMVQSRVTRLGAKHLPQHVGWSLLVGGLGRCANCDGVLSAGNSYRCRAHVRGGLSACAQPVNASIHAVDRRVASAWRDLVGTHDPATETIREAVAQLWAPAPAQPTDWSRLNGELRELHARLDDADAAHYVRHHLDARRHSAVAHKLALQITGVEAALATTDPHIDTRALNDPDYVAQHWNAATPPARRQLLRLAWTKVTIAKAATRGHFDPNRISYLR